MSDNSRQMTRRRFLQTSIAGSAALMGLEKLSFAAAENGLKKQPNFVFILTDDQRFDAMSCAGHPFLRTPNIDRIANEGAKFNNAFVTTSLCAPSRASFLTGRYAHSHKVMRNYAKDPDPETQFPMRLRNAGYETAFIGKWHLTNSAHPRPAFDYWLSFPGQGVYKNPKVNLNGKEVKTSGYMTDILTKYAVDWLKQPRSKPFCLYLSHKAVHGPLEPAIRHSKLYSDVKIDKPKSWVDDLKGKPKWVAKRQKTSHGITSEEDLESFIKEYNRTTAAVDDSVGRVLETLEELGVLDDTVVIFAGDNGYFIGEHRLLDKRAMYEESIRIPLVMRYPKLVKPGTQIDSMALNIDLCPTILDIAGVRAPETVQGRSLKPLLAGKIPEWRQDFLYEYYCDRMFPVTPTVRGVRSERWKYIEYPETDDTAELYDLKNDPHELHNLIDDPAQAKVLADMRARLKRLMEETRYNE